jgi:ribokinase
LLNLVCLGNVTIDDVVLYDGSVSMGAFGGDAVFAAMAAALWSPDVRFVAPIGNDYPPENIQALKERGWGAECMPVRAVPTHRSWVIYENDGRRTWVLRSNPDDFFILSPLVDDIPPALRETRAFLVLAMDLAAQENLVYGLHGGPALIALDPQEDNIVGNEKRFLEMLPKVDIFLPSEIEAERLLGHKDYRRAAQEFSEYGCKIVVIKLGEKGSLLFDSVANQFYEIPIFPTQTVDPTGAGDSFSGGFMSQYALSQDIYHSGLAGTVSSSFCVQGFGLTHMFAVTPDMAAQRLELLKARLEQTQPGQ